MKSVNAILFVPVPTKVKGPDWDYTIDILKVAKIQGEPYFKAQWSSHPG